MSKATVPYWWSDRLERASEVLADLVERADNREGVGSEELVGMAEEVMRAARLLEQEATRLAFTGQFSVRRG